MSRKYRLNMCLEMSSYFQTRKIYIFLEKNTLPNSESPSNKWNLPIHYVKRKPGSVNLSIQSPFNRNDVICQQDINLHHHVHGFQQIFGKAAVLEEKRIEAVMYIIQEKLHGADLGQDFFNDVLVVMQYLVERVRPEAVARHEVQILPEREPSQVVALHDTVEFRVLFLQPHNCSCHF